MKSCFTKPTDNAAYQQYVEQILEATSSQGLIKHFIPGRRNSREKSAWNTPDALVT